MKRRLNLNGFTLLEILLVIAVLGALLAFTTPAYTTFKLRNELDTSTNDVVGVLRRAQLVSKLAEEDSGWSVHLDNNQATLFKGSDFLNRDQGSDEIYTPPSSVSFSGLNEVSYGRGSGAASTTGDIIVNSQNEKRTISIVNDKGVLDY